MRIEDTVKYYEDVIEEARDVARRIAAQINYETSYTYVETFARELAIAHCKDALGRADAKHYAPLRSPDEDYDWAKEYSRPAGRGIDNTVKPGDYYPVDKPK